MDEDYFWYNVLGQKAHEKKKQLDKDELEAAVKFGLLNASVEMQWDKTGKAIKKKGLFGFR